jgi:hypothetical protein
MQVAAALSEAEKLETINTQIKTLEAALKESKFAFTTPDILLGEKGMGAYRAATDKIVSTLISKYPKIAKAVKFVDKSVGVTIKAFPSYYKGNVITGAQNWPETKERIQKDIFKNIKTDEGTFNDTLDDVYYNAYKASIASQMAELFAASGGERDLTPEEERMFREQAYKDAMEAKRKAIQGYLLNHPTLRRSYDAIMAKGLANEISKNMQMGIPFYFADYFTDIILLKGLNSSAKRNVLRLVSNRTLMGRSANVLATGVSKVIGGVASAAPEMLASSTYEALDEGYKEKAAQELNAVELEKAFQEETGMLSDEQYAKLMKVYDQSYVPFMRDQFIANWHNEGSWKEAESAFWGTIATGGLGGTVNIFRNTIVNTNAAAQLGRLEKAHRDALALAISKKLTADEIQNLFSFNNKMSQTLQVAKIAAQIEAEQEKLDKGSKKYKELEKAKKTFIQLMNLNSVEELVDKYGEAAVVGMLENIDTGGKNLEESLKEKREELNAKVRRLSKMEPSDIEKLYGEEINAINEDLEKIQSLKGTKKIPLQYIEALRESEKIEATISRDEDENEVLTERLRRGYVKNRMRINSIDDQMEEIGSSIEALNKELKVEESKGNEKKTKQIKEELKELDATKEKLKEMRTALVEKHADYTEKTVNGANSGEIASSKALYSKREVIEQQKDSIIDYVLQNIKRADIKQIINDIKEDEEKNISEDEKIVKALFSGEMSGIKKLTYKILGRRFNEKFDIEKLKELGFSRTDLEDIAHSISVIVQGMSSAIYVSEKLNSSRLNGNITLRNKIQDNYVKYLKMIEKGKSNAVTDADIFTITKTDKGIYLLSYVDGGRVREMEIEEEEAKIISESKKVLETHSPDEAAEAAKENLSIAINRIFSKLAAMEVKDEEDNDFSYERINARMKNTIGQLLEFSKIEDEDEDIINSLFDYDSANYTELFNKTFEDEAFNEIREAIDFFNKKENEKYRVALFNEADMPFQPKITAEDLFKHIIRNKDKYGELRYIDINDAETMLKGVLGVSMSNIILRAINSAEKEEKELLKNSMTIKTKLYKNSEKNC